MNLKKIEWNRVTKFSQIVALALFVGVFALGFTLGRMYEFKAFQHALLGGIAGIATPLHPGEKSIADTTYMCDGGKSVRALYFKSSLDMQLSDDRTFTLAQVVSADGARYGNSDGSFVFWNKGNTAFITEGVGKKATTTFANCVAKPIPE